MSIVTNNQLTFHTTTFNPVVKAGQIWLTSKELARALEYSSAKSVTDIYNNNSDEFTQAMSLVVESTTNGINDSKRRMKVRVFSLRGAHLIAMFARTPVAKEFRRWILDILDREISEGNHGPIIEKIYNMHLTGAELCSMAWLYKSAKHMREEIEQTSAGLLKLKSPYGNSLEMMAHEYKCTLDAAWSILNRVTADMTEWEITSPNWRAVLPDLKVH